MSKETCQRCGDEGEDLRTLWMACFYAMRELGLPFEEVAVDGRLVNKIGADKHQLFEGGPSIETPLWSKPKGKKDLRQFYTLRVCKDCRADWMSSIKSWFVNVPKREGCGSGIFVRKNGAVVEITEEEWYKDNPGREPIRMKVEG